MNALKTLRRATLRPSNYHNHYHHQILRRTQLTSKPFHPRPYIPSLSRQSRCFCDKTGGSGNGDGNGEEAPPVEGEAVAAEAEEEDPEAAAAKAQAELRSAEKRKSKEAAKRYASERMEYEKKLKNLRKLFAEEHDRKASSSGGSKPKTFKKNAWAKPVPTEMLPKIKLPKELTPEWLEKMAEERSEAKAGRRRYEVERREKEEKEKAERKQRMVEKMEDEVEMWLSERDLDNPKLFEAKVAVQLENLVPLQEAFYEELPSQPYRFYNMYHRDEVVRESLTADRHLPTAEPDGLDELLVYESDGVNATSPGENSRSGGQSGGATGIRTGLQAGAGRTDASGGVGANGKAKSSEILQILQEMENKPKDKAD